MIWDAQGYVAWFQEKSERAWGRPGDYIPAYKYFAHVASMQDWFAILLNTKYHLQFPFTKLIAWLHLSLTCYSSLTLFYMGGGSNRSPLIDYRIPILVECPKWADFS